MAKNKKNKDDAPKVPVVKEPVYAEGTMITCDDGEDRPVVFRATALELGVNRYFMGTPCANDHVAERKVKGYVCTACARIKAKARHKRKLVEDPEYKEKVATKRQAKHKERMANDKDYRDRFNQKAKDRRARKTADKQAG